MNGLFRLSMTWLRHALDLAARILGHGAERRDDTPDRRHVDPDPFGRFLAECLKLGGDRGLNLVNGAVGQTGVHGREARSKIAEGAAHQLDRPVVDHRFVMLSHAYVSWCRLHDETPWTPGGQALQENKA